MAWSNFLVDYTNPRSIGARLRKRRILPFLDLVRQCHRERGQCRIVDIGGTEAYWRIVDPEFLEAHGCHITLVNPRPAPNSGRPGFSHVQGNGCRLGFGDNAFDIAHSNSAIEHVGGWLQMEQFAAEISRVAPMYFVQTPNFWFPIEPHYLAPGIQFLPPQMQARLLLKFPLRWINRPRTLPQAMRTVQSISLLTESMLRVLLPDAEISHERVLGLKKSLIAIRRRH